MYRAFAQRKIPETFVIADASKSKGIKQSRASGSQNVRGGHSLHAGVETDKSESTFDLLRHACMLNHFSRVRLFVTLWIVARQTPLSMEFSRHENWSGLPFPPPGDLPYLRSEPASLMGLLHRMQIFFTTEPPGKSYNSSYRSDFSKSGNIMPSYFSMFYP